MEKGVITGADLRSPYFKALANLYDQMRLLIKEKKLHTLTVTSAVTEEGRTTVSVNISLAFASMARMNTVLVDADIFNPSLHRIFGQEREGGLVDVLMGEQDLASAIKTTGTKNLSLLTGGKPISSPSGLFLAEGMKELVQHLRESYDLVIFDTPPLIASSDAVALCGMVDGVVLVVWAGKTRREVVQLACSSLENAKAKILGVVLNKRIFHIPEFIYRHL